MGLDALPADRLHDPGLELPSQRLAVLVRAKGDAGVVHQDVEPAELALDRREHRPDLGAVGDVGLDRATACRVAHLLHRRLGGLEPDVVDDDARALLREGEADGPADARPAAGHERDPIAELQRFRLLQDSGSINKSCRA